MADTLCNSLLGYWAGLHGGPKAQTPNVEDAVFRALSPNVFMLSREGDGRVLFSAAGSFVRKKFSQPVEGSDFFSFWSEEDQRLLRPMIATMNARKVPISVVAEFAAGGATTVCLEFALMPITGTELSWVLGIMVCVSNHINFAIFPNSLRVVKATPLDIDSDKGATVFPLRRRHAANG
ncbi:MAG: PAS domain-containing protein [Alphaproteobacteria bacterium]|nr:PAS domain-containing protein [Alphaproteobacteria bacterium]